MGDALFSFLLSKTINIKTIEELTLSHVFIENLKSKRVLGILQQMKRLKSLKLSNNNITDYLELVKFECFSNLINLTISKNPICSCLYIREFAVYRFNNLRYFNKIPIDYQDLQKAKTVFNSFDKILQLPSQFNQKTKDSKLSQKQISQVCKSMADSIVSQLEMMEQADSLFGEVWIEICQEIDLLA